jgi:hypothetical protein
MYIYIHIYNDDIQICVYIYIIYIYIYNDDIQICIYIEYA